MNLSVVINFIRSAIDLIAVWFILYYLISFVNINLKTFKKILCTILLAILIFNFCITEYNKALKELKIYFIDVGQGDSTLVVTPSLKTVLIDGGEEKNILVNYLLDRRIKTIDYILISHL